MAVGVHTPASKPVHVWVCSDGARQSVLCLLEFCEKVRRQDSRSLYLLETLFLKQVPRCQESKRKWNSMMEKMSLDNKANADLLPKLLLPSF